MHDHTEENKALIADICEIQARNENRDKAVTINETPQVTVCENVLITTDRGMAIFVVGLLGAVAAVIAATIWICMKFNY